MNTSMHAPSSPSAPSYLIDINILVIAAVVPVFVELNIVIHTLMAIRIRLVDLGRFRQLPVRLQTSRLIRTVLEDDVPLLVLIVSEGQKYDVALVDPDLLAELAADVCEALFAVEAESFETAVAEHFDDLRVFLAFLFEGQFALLVVILVLSTTSIFTTFSFVLGHIDLFWLCQKWVEVVLSCWWDNKIEWL